MSIDQGLANYGLCVKESLCLFLQVVLLGNSHAYVLHFLYGCCHGRVEYLWQRPYGP